MNKRTVQICITMSDEEFIKLKELQDKLKISRREILMKAVDELSKPC